MPLVKGGRLAALLFAHHPEPRAWTPAEVEAAEEACARLWNAVERARAEAAPAESEARWRGLFERMHEGVALCEMVYGPDGAAVGHRHLGVNAAVERLTTLPPAALVGRRASGEAVLGIEGLWTDAFARVVETGEPAHLEHGIAALGGWFEVFACRTEPGRFAVLSQNVTERKRAEARRDALVELGDRLRDLRDPGEIARAAAEVIGRALGASRAGGLRRLGRRRGRPPHRARLDR